MSINPGRFRLRPNNSNGFVTYSGDLGIIGTKLHDCLCANCVTEVAPFIDHLKIAINEKGVVNTADEYLGLMSTMLNTHCGFNYFIEEVNSDGEYVIIA